MNEAFLMVMIFVCDANLGYFQTHIPQFGRQGHDNDRVPVLAEPCKQGQQRVLPDQHSRLLMCHEHKRKNLEEVDTDVVALVTLEPLKQFHQEGPRSTKRLVDANGR